MVGANMAARMLLVPALLMSTSVTARTAPTEEARVLDTVRAFYEAYDTGFIGPAAFATSDWNHINPGGGRTRGKAAVLAEVRSVHQTFLKDVRDSIVDADVRFAAKDVAVATVTSRTTAFKMPGEDVARQHGQIRTFVIVKRGTRWLIMQDHNTEMPPASTMSSATADHN